MFALLDTLRRGAALEALGFGPTERGYRILASGRRWCLRDYAGADAEPSLLIIPAPIKRPYIWDLAPAVSAVSYCLHRRLRVYLLERLPPSHGDGDDGLAHRRVSRADSGIEPSSPFAKRLVGDLLLGAIEL